jgi:hypothetical protein
MPSQGNNKNKNTRNRISGSNVRASQQRRLNSTLDNYQGPTGRITQTLIDAQNTVSLVTNPALNNEGVSTGVGVLPDHISHHGQQKTTKARVGSKMRGNKSNLEGTHQNVKQQLTIAKDVSREPLQIRV